MKILKGIILLVSIFFVSSFSFADYNNLKEAVTSATSIKTYSLTTNETVTENLGYLGGTQLTIFGNGHDIEANNSVSGISVGEGKILNIEGVNDITKFYSNSWGGAISNYGTTNIGNDVKLSFNTSGGGGAIHNNGLLTIGSNVIFSTNTANRDGGAISNSGGTVTIGTNALFECNKTNASGGAIANTDDGNTTIEDNVNFILNRANYAGAVWNQSEMLIKNNVSYISNESNYYGGALVNTKATLTIQDNNSFIKNTSQVGGAITNFALQTDLKEGIINIGNNVNFTSNTATQNGGAIYNFGEEDITYYNGKQESHSTTKASTINISSNSTFTYNTTISSGGAICNNGNITIEQNTNFSSNSAKYGGAIYNNGNINIANNGYYYGNSASVGGALLNFESGVMNIGYDSCFESNTATIGEGGAIENCGTLTISSGTKFVLNEANTNGGAISNAMYINGDFVANANIANDVLFSSNTANYGGGLSNISAITNIGNNNIFEYNTANSEGGAIYNTKNDYKNVVGQITISSNTKFLNNTATNLGGAIFNNSGIITVYSTTTFTNNSAYNGGAIASLYEGALITIGDDAIFSSNTAITNGGAIYNETGTVNIGKNSKFEFNKTGVTDNGANGGAIANFGTMVIDENAKFTSNYTGTDGSGGAIHNCKNYDGTIGNLTIKDGASFTKNMATSGGGAISNYNGGIINILDNVSFTSNTANRFGGAILNFTDGNISAGTINIGNNVLFSNNKAQTDCGGAITNVGTITIGDNATFEQNSSAGSGGAIYNSKRGNITIGENVTFSNNTEQQNGGAIHNEGILTLLDGGTFINNSANGTGGAIYLYNDNITEIPNSRTVNLIAKTNNIEFTGNTANGVSNAIHSNGGTINLWASNSASVIFNDAITSYDGAGKTNVLNINKASGDLPTTGKIVLNEDMSGYGGQVNLYNGEIELQSKTEENSNINTNKLFSGNINLNKGTLNILNNAIDNISVNNLTTTSNTNLKFDVDLSNNTSDNFTTTNNVTGQLNLTAINILGVDGTSGQITLFNNGNAPDLNILTTATYGGYEYNFTNSNSMVGVLNYTRGEQTNLKKAVNKTTPATRSYSLSENETVTEDLGNLGGTQLTVFGNGHDIAANNVEGITIYYENQILNIEGVGNITGFKKNDHSGGAIMNHGTVNIGEGINFVSNSSISDDIDSGSRGGAIYNYNPNATLNIANNVSFTSNTASIQGGAVHNYFGTVNIEDNVTFTSNTSTRGGGAVMNQSASSYFTIGNNAKFSNNSVSQVNGGGAILNLGYFNIGSSATFSNNKETATEISDGILAGGGAIHNLSGKAGSEEYNSYLTIGEYSLFENNQSNNLGGAIFNNIINNEGEVIVKDNAIFSSNTARNGGAIANLEGNIDIGKNVIFSSNVAKSISGLTSLGGGAIYNMGNISIGSNTVFYSNIAADYGGAIYNLQAGSISVSSDTQFTLNHANDEGGAIRNEGYFKSDTGLIFTSNTARNGGAMHNTDNGTIIIGSSTIFEKNFADNSGGAINNKGIFEIGSNSQFISNESQYGGAILNNLNSSNLTIRDTTTFINNKATISGGAIYNMNSATINIGTNSNFSYNTATKNGGAIYNGGNISIGDNSKFEYNQTSVYGGGAIFNEGQLRIGSNVVFSSNTTPDGGGAIDNQNAGVVIVGENALFEYNKSSVIGGAIRNASDDSDLFFIGNNSSFFSNEAEILGGAIWNSKEMIINDGVSYYQNKATNCGGAIANCAIEEGAKDGKLNIGNFVSFTSNTANYGGAIYNFGEEDITLYGQQFHTHKGTINISSNSAFSYNTATNTGGAIYNGGNMNIGSGTKFISNKSTGLGGGAIWNSANMIINDDAIYNSNESTQFGGAIWNAGMLTLKENNSFVLNNSDKGGAINNLSIYSFSSDGIINIEKNVNFTSNTATYGGAIYNFGEEELEVYEQSYYTQKGIINISSNSTFSNNTANKYGGAIYNGGNLTIGDGAIFSSNTAGSGGAIYNYSGTLNLIANTNNIEFTGNTANGVSNAIYSNAGVINLWASDTASVIFNDRITSNISSVLNINKEIEGYQNNLGTGKIILNEDMSGYTGQTNLYDGTIKLGGKGTLFGGNMLVDNATIDMANEIIQEHNFNMLTLNNTLNLVVDVDLQNETMDTISANDSSQINGTINVKAINILSDAKEKETEILFTSSTVLKDKITSVKTASSKLYNYDVLYNQNTGYFSFTKGDIPPIPVVNPILLESAIASSVGGYATQSIISNQAFTSIDTQRNKVRQAKANRLLYASTSDMVYDNTNKIESGLWLRPYVTQETVKLEDLDVDNNVYGTLAGLDLSVGENGLISFYLGYAGSNQKYEEIKVNQTGYIIGATGMIVKENYYVGLTANVGFNKAESESVYGTDKFDMNMYSVGAKAGYDFDLGKNWILEPSLTLMYGTVGNKEYETVQGAKIDSQNVNNLHVEPQIKAKLDLTNGWTPYALLGYATNVGDKSKVVADNVEFETAKIDGYVEYGVGFNKDFINTHWSCYLQATGRSGGRNGFSGNLGVKYSFGNTKKSYVKPVKKEVVKDNVIKKKSSFLDEQEEPKKEIEKEPKIVEIREEETNQKSKVVEGKQEQKIQEESVIEKSIEIKNEEVKQEKAIEEKARVEEEKRKKDEQTRQKALEKERRKFEKEEKEKQKMLEIEKNFRKIITKNLK